VHGRFKSSRRPVDSHLRSIDRQNCPVQRPLVPKTRAIIAFTRLNFRLDDVPMPAYTTRAFKGVRFGFYFWR